MQVFFQKNFICDEKLRKNDLLNCDKNLLNGVEKQKKELVFLRVLFCGANGIRTSDTRIFSPMLYQLSYGTKMQTESTTPPKLPPLIKRLFLVCGCKGT